MARAGCAALAAGVIAACSGGGGGGGSAPPQFTVSPTSLSFSAASPNAATPLSQTVTATVNGVNAGTLFIRIVVTGPAVANVTNPIITGPTTGQVTVLPAIPSVIGPGTHTSTLTVIACTTDINCSGPQLTGSPATVNVTYSVGAIPPAPNAVAPSVGTAGVPGEVIIRGSGFGPGTSVTFDAGIAATSLVVMSASEIRASYPALLAGPHAVNVTGNSSPFTGSLHMVQPGALVDATLNYPLPPQNMRGLVYDARRDALIVGAGFSTPASNEVLRYTFSGVAWSAVPQNAATVANLRGFTLSIDGERLLAITDNSLVELNPATLAVQATTPRTTNLSTDPGSFLKSIVATNDGQALVVAGGPNFNQRWLYAVAARTFSIPFFGQFAPAIGGPDDGSRVVLVEGGLSPAQPALQYSASSGLVSPTSLVLAQFHPVPGRVEDINSPVFDRKGTRMLAAGFSGGVVHTVYDANFAELGRVPSGNVGVTTAAYALSPDGTRAYILEFGTGPSVCRLRAFDVSASAGVGMQFPETVPGFPIDLLAAGTCPASRFDTPIRILLNPPGDTLFIAGDLSIRVVRP
jgi:hypothetical protein